jgi:hypothetical protein
LRRTKTSPCAPPRISRPSVPGTRCSHRARMASSTPPILGPSHQPRSTLRPSPQGGLSNVEFAVRTLGPQIWLASYDLDRRFGIDDAVAGRRAVDLYDPRQLREAVVLTVLYKQYLDQSRQFSGASDAPDDVYAAKSRIAKAELDEVLDRLALKWNEADVACRAIATTRFSTRISR